MSGTHGNVDVVRLDSVPIHLVGIIQISALCRILCFACMNTCVGTLLTMTLDGYLCSQEL